MNSILVIDDDIEIHSQIKLALGAENLFVASSFAEARKILNTYRFDLIILDILLPDGDGLQFLMELKSNNSYAELPIIFLTSRNQSNDKVAGLSLGAEDYVTKPFDRQELKARVALRVEKSKRVQTAKHQLQVKDLQFDLSTGQLFVTKKLERMAVDLTAFEFKLLLYFAEHEEQVLSRQHILDAVWGVGMNVMDRTIDAHVCNLRKKLKESSFCLRAVYGAGYQLIEASHILTKKSA